MNHSSFDEIPKNTLRIHRRRSGLSHKELSMILGYASEGTVARHESHRTTPSLVIAISYEIVFKAPVGEIFAGLRAVLSENIESRLAGLESDLGKRTTRDRDAAIIARKLTWLFERKNPDIDDG